MEEIQNQTKKGMNPIIPFGIIILILAAGLFFLRKQTTQTIAGNRSADFVSDTNSNIQKTSSISVEGGNYYFKPNQIRVKKGEKVIITLTGANSPKSMHNFIIDELKVASETISEGQTTQVEFTPDKTGEFEFYCSISNHKAMGMKGTLIVD